GVAHDVGQGLLDDAERGLAPRRVHAGVVARHVELELHVAALLEALHEPLHGAGEAHLVEDARAEVAHDAAGRLRGAREEGVEVGAGGLGPLPEARADVGERVPEGRQVLPEIDRRDRALRRRDGARRAVTLREVATGQPTRLPRVRTITHLPARLWRRSMKTK